MTSMFNPGCCCDSCPIIEQNMGVHLEDDGIGHLSQVAYTPPAWDLSKWTQDAGTWSIVSNGLETSSSNAVLRCNTLWTSDGTTPYGPNVRIEIVDAADDDEIYLWWTIAGNTYSWLVKIGQYAEFDILGETWRVHADAVQNDSDVTTYAGLTPFYPPFTVDGDTHRGQLIIQQCYYSEDESNAVTRCCVHFDGCDLAIEPHHSRSSTGIATSGSWGIGTGTISGTIRIGGAAAYNVKKRDGIDYWFDWETDPRPYETDIYAVYEWITPAAPTNCNTSGWRNREYVGGSFPTMPREWLVVQGAYGMWPTGSPCNALAGGILTMCTMNNAYIPTQYKYGGVNDGACKWSFWRPTSTADGKVLYTHLIDCVQHDAKHVYEITVRIDYLDSAKLKIELAIYAWNDTVSANGVLYYNATVDRYTDITALTDLRLDYAGGTGFAYCNNCDNDPFDWADTYFLVTSQL